MMDTKEWTNTQTEQPFEEMQQRFFTKLKSVSQTENNEYFTMEIKTRTYAHTKDEACKQVEAQARAFLKDTDWTSQRFSSVEAREEQL